MVMWDSKPEPIYEYSAGRILSDHLDEVFCEHSLLSHEGERC